MSSTKKSSSSLWPSTNQPLLDGIITPLVTPLLVDDDSNTNIIDVESTRKIIEHVITGGVSGLFLLGTTGEGPTLSRSCKQQFISTCCSIVNGRIPILVLITCSSIHETIELAKYCQNLSEGGGVSAVVLTTPYYFPLDQPELVRYVDLVIDGMNNNHNNNNNKDNDNISKPLPIMLYNIPVLTKVQWDIDSIRQIITKYPTQIVGMKDSSGNLEYFQELCELRNELQRQDDFTILMGPEHLTLESMKLGSNGGVNGGSNVEPQLFVQLYNEAISAAAAASSKVTASRNEQQEEPPQQEQRVQKLQNRVLAFQDIYKVGNNGNQKHAFPFVAATKCAMKIKNLCSNDILSEPMIPFNEDERQQVETILNNLPDI